jgi:hypothetical protein
VASLEKKARKPKTEVSNIGIFKYLYNEGRRETGGVGRGREGSVFPLTVDRFAVYDNGTDHACA